MANLNLNGDVSQNEKILEMAYKDLIVFGKLFSPQDFLASATPDFHVNVGKLLLHGNLELLMLKSLEVRIIYQKQSNPYKPSQESSHSVKHRHLSLN
jgi:hypothetical protein